MEPLSSGFFQTPTLELAKGLLGCLLVKETAEGIASGYIVETEAYLGPEDRAAHSYAETVVPNEPKLCLAKQVPSIPI